MCAKCRKTHTGQPTTQEKNQIRSDREALEITVPTSQ